jgi:phosphopantothenoylcysteine decarboxylase/phosphopantothenate--cysteine ligase
VVVSKLAGKRIVLGVCGSIAAFKAAQLCSTLVQAGAEVDVVLTEAAQRFVTPLTFQSLTRRPVYTDLYDVLPDYSSAHVELGSRADVLVVCPATATTLARLAHGLADDMLACVALASPAPLVLAPAMNVNMWQHPATQENVARLRQRGALFVGPVVGRLAEGIVAMGRLAPLEDVLAAVRVALGRAQKSVLAGRRLVVTAGGTQEPIDPVRFIGNRSSGKMGYAIAEAARDRGAQVTLISGPVALPRPWGLEVITVATAREMEAAVLDACAEADALIMAAAVADYRPERAAEHKLKKTGAPLALTLVQNPDVLATVHARYGDRLIKIGFAAESRDVLAEAARKLAAKGLHLICANDVTEPGSGFGTNTNRVTILDRGGGREDLPVLPKEEVAEHILDRLERLLG